MENILVIDDDETLYTMLTRALSRRGLDAKGACNTQTTLPRAQHRSPGSHRA